MRDLNKYFLEKLIIFLLVKIDEFEVYEWSYLIIIFGFVCVIVIFKFISFKVMKIVVGKYKFIVWELM